jgi:hypothetical protein
MDGPRWLARQAWALEQLGLNDEAEKVWTTLGAIATKQWAKNQEILPYSALGRKRQLASSLERFRKIRFSENNEKPTANIGKKTKALEALETEAQSLIKIGSPKVQVEAQKTIQMGYLEFAETMRTAAVPKALSQAEQEALKSSFEAVANQLIEKAKAMVVGELIASDKNVRNPGSEIPPVDETIDPVAKLYF